MRHTFKSGLSLALFTLTCSHAAWAGDPESCATIRMPEPGWADINATNAVAGVLLDAQGYHQKVDNLSVPIIYRGLQMGQADVFLGNWMPAQKPMVEGLLKDGLIESVQSNLDQAKFTLAVPSYVAATGVTNFADLD